MGIAAQREGGYWQGNHREGELLGMKAFAPNEISSHYFKRLEEQAAHDEILMAAQNLIDANRLRQKEIAYPNEG